MRECPAGKRLVWHFRKSGRYSAFKCMGLRCPVCGRQAARRLADKIGSWAAERGLWRFWTFTLDPARIPGIVYRPGIPLDTGQTSKAVDYLRAVWNKYLTRWRRDDPRLSFIAVLELQESGNPHLHVLVSGWYSWGVMRARWRRYGGGAQVYVTALARRSAEGAARYMGKYLSKATPVDSEDAIEELSPEEPVRTLDTWPKGTRHHTSSRDIHLRMTATQWRACDDEEWRYCFPRIVGLEAADLESICRHCIYRRAPRAPCSGVCEPAELTDGLGPVGARRRLPPPLIVWESHVHEVDVSGIPAHIPAMGRLCRTVPGFFRDAESKEWREGNGR